MSEWVIEKSEHKIFAIRRLKMTTLECSSNVVQNLIQQQMAAHLHLLYLLQIFNSCFTWDPSKTDPLVKQQERKLVLESLHVSGSLSISLYYLNTYCIIFTLIIHLCTLTFSSVWSNTLPYFHFQKL